MGPRIDPSIEGRQHSAVEEERNAEDHEKCSDARRLEVMSDVALYVWSN